jgi:hypothetical protein
MARLRATRLWVGGGGFGVPRQDFGAESIQLPPTNLAYEVVHLEGILLQLVVLFLLVAEVVDVLLLPPDPGRAQQVGPAAEEQGAILGTLSRGKALRLMGAALVGGTLGSLGIGEAAAAPSGCKRNGKKCKQNTQCCSENCVDGVCGPACVSDGGTYSTSTDCCSENCSNGFCCASGRVGLSNGTCVKACTSSDDCPGCTSGCEHTAFTGPIHVCSNGVVAPLDLCPGGHSDCPEGQFCQFEADFGGVCAVPC